MASGVMSVPSGISSGESLAAAERLMTTLLFGVNVSSLVKARPCSNWIPITLK